MDSIEYLKRHREKEGLSFRKMAKKAGVSGGYWYILFDTNTPPTIEKAAQIARGTDMDIKMFLNLVFRDRMLRFLAKEKLNEHNSTEEIKQIAKVFESWDPEKQTLEEAIRYIMSTKSLSKSLTVQRLLSIFEELHPSLNIADKTVLSRPRKNAVGGCGKEAGGGKRGSGQGHILESCSKGSAVMLV